MRASDASPRIIEICLVVCETSHAVHHCHANSISIWQSKDTNTNCSAAADSTVTTPLATILIYVLQRKLLTEKSPRQSTSSRGK